MAATSKRLPARLLTFVITGGGTIAAIRNLKINRKRGKFEATAAQADYDQSVLGRRSISGSYEMFLGTEGVPPGEGDQLTALSVSEGGGEVTAPDIDNATVYG